jgi:hypothetical protein
MSSPAIEHEIQSFIAAGNISKSGNAERFIRIINQYTKLLKERIEIAYPKSPSMCHRLENIFRQAIEHGGLDLNQDCNGTHLLLRCAPIVQLHVLEQQTLNLSLLIRREDLTVMEWAFSGWSAYKIHRALNLLLDRAPTETFTIGVIRNVLQNMRIEDTNLYYRFEPLLTGGLWRRMASFFPECVQQKEDDKLTEDQSQCVARNIVVLSDWTLAVEKTLPKINEFLSRATTVDIYMMVIDYLAPVLKIQPNHTLVATETKVQIKHSEPNCCVVS